jgi:hypothetical protein
MQRARNVAAALRMDDDVTSLIAGLQSLKQQSEDLTVN